jgi:O-antigen ligase
MGAPALGCFGVLLILAWLIPNHYPPWLMGYSDALAASATVVLAAIVALDRRARSSAPWAAAFLASLALVPAAQAALGLVVFAGDAWIVVLYLLCAAAAVMWSAQAARADARRWGSCLATAILAGALASAFILCAQRWVVDLGPLMLFIRDVAPGRPPGANLSQPNQLATLLALGLASVMYLFERRALAPAYAAAGAALLTFALVVTQSRTALLFWLVVLAWHFRFARAVGLRTPRAAVVSLAAGWLVLFPLWPSVVEAMGFANLASASSRLSPGPRTLIWSQMVQAIAAHPWLGYGWNQTGFAQVPIAIHARSLQFFDSAHNLLLDLAVWNGLPLAVVVVVAATVWLAGAARNLQTATGAFAFLGVLLLLTHAMVEFPLAYLYFLVPFALLIGIVSNEAYPEQRFSLPDTTRLALPLLMAAALVVAVIDYAHMQEEFTEMRFLTARFGRPMPEEAPPPPRTEFTQLAALHHFSLTTPKGPVEARELAWMRDVAYRYPYSPNLHRYALAQALHGDVAGARETIMALRHMYGEPTYASARAELLRMAQQHPILRQLELPEPRLERGPP